MCGSSFRTGALPLPRPQDMQEAPIWEHSGDQGQGRQLMASSGLSPVNHKSGMLPSDILGVQLRAKGRHAGLDGLSPPVSPRSACSTPGRADALNRGFKRCLPARQASSNDKQRFSQDNKRASPFCGNPWVDMGSQGRGSSYSSSSSCSIIRAISALGLEGPRTPSPAAEQPVAPTGMRGSISKAKKILAEAISSVPGAHGIASCASSAADTGVLSPLLTIIRNNGLVKSAADSSSRHKAASRRSSFSHPMSSRSSFDSSSATRRVQRRSSFTEACGGLDQDDFAGDSCCSALEATRSSSSTTSSNSSSTCSPPPGFESPSTAAQAAAQAQQKVVDCLETVRYLAMDESNRMALIDLGAVELLLHKLQQTPTLGKPHSSSSAISAAPAVVEATLSALYVLAKHDATKLRVWDNPGSAALLQLLSTRHTSPVVKAAHLCCAHLAWSADCDRAAYAGSGSSSVFDSVSSHPGRDDASTTSSSGCGSNVLLTSALIPALAAGLHPAADAPVLLSLLKLLTKAASSSCMASSASTPAGSSCASECSDEPLGTVTLSRAHSPAWRVGWQQVIFALPPLLVRLDATSRGGSNPGCQQHVLGAALELMTTLTEQHPEFHASICAAGCVPPLLMLLLALSQTCSDHTLQAACVLNNLLDCPGVAVLLGQERSLQLLLQVLDNSQQTVDVRLAMLHMLRRLAAASHSCVGVLKAQGAVPIVATLLQQVHANEVKRTAVGLLHLLGKQVVVRPRRPQHDSGSSSLRSSFESACSDSFQASPLDPVNVAVPHLEQLALQQQQQSVRGQHSHSHAGQHRLAQPQLQYTSQQTLAPCY